MMKTRWLWCTFASLGLLFGFKNVARAYTPDDPVVQAMVDRGLRFLESYSISAAGGEASNQAGQVVLMAYAHHKCRHDPENPVVKRGVDVAKRLASEAEEHAKSAHEGSYVYPVCVLLLADVDPVGYRPELEKLAKGIASIQRRDGAYSYPKHETGDTSQTQYGMLAVWTLDRIGIPLDYSRVASTIAWLTRVQDQSGSWPYQGHDPGPGKPLLAQKRVDMSMGLAGASSMLIGGDALRVWGNTQEDEDTGIPGLPKAVKLYKEDENGRARKRGSVSPELIFRSVNFFEAWRQKNPYKPVAGINFRYYLLYTMERFESFKEIAKHLPKDKSPAWYNAGVEYLKTAQDAESGGWKERSRTPPNVDTSFALLFLVRSTQKSISAPTSSSLAGGRGFPTDATNIRLEGGQIKGQAIATQVTDLLSILEKDGSGDTEGKSIPDNLELATDPEDRRAQLDRLERLLRGSQSYQARRVAAKLLGRSDELKVAPALIFALSDPDVVVHNFARDGLRFISRKFDGFDFPKRPSNVNDENAMGRWRAEVEEVQDKWRQWYKRIDPTYVFLDV